MGHGEDYLFVSNENIKTVGTSRSVTTGTPFRRRRKGEDRGVWVSQHGHGEDYLLVSDENIKIIGPSRSVGMGTPIHL